MAAYQTEAHDLSGEGIRGQDGPQHHWLQVLGDHRVLGELSRVHDGDLLAAVLLGLKQNTPPRIPPLDEQNPSTSLLKNK